MRAAGVCSMLVLCAAAPAGAQDFTDWLNSRIDSVVAVHASIRQEGKQALVPVGSASDASLVDRANMPDITGISIKLPNQASSGGAIQPGTMSLSFTPYVLWALFDGHPLNPEGYLKRAATRRLGLSATFDTDSTGKTSPVFQAKLLIIDRGSALQFDKQNSVRTALGRAATQFGELAETILAFLYQKVGQQRFAGRPCPGTTCSDEFVNSLTQPNVLAGVLAAIGPQGLNEIDTMILDHIDSFVALRSVVDSLQTQARTKPELSVGLTGNGSGIRARQLRAIAIYDVGRANYDVTFNAGYQYIEASASATKQNRLVAAAQFLWRLTPDNRLTGRSAMSLTFAMSGAVDPGQFNRGVAKVQARLMLPLAEGLNVPLSVTWASRTDLIDEARVRGLIGFSFNVAQILDAVQ